MRQNRIHNSEFATDQQSSSEFVNATREMVLQHSQRLDLSEIQDCINHDKTHQLMLKVWEFAGCYHLWPEALLSRTDLTATLRNVLQRHHIENDKHKNTTAFKHLAQSLGISLPDPPPQGWLISSAVTCAELSQLSEALGKYFANDCLRNLPELTNNIAHTLNIDVPLVDQSPQSIHFHHELSHEQDRAIFSGAAQAYAIQFTIYTNQIRALI